MKAHRKINRNSANVFPFSRECYTSSKSAFIAVLVQLLSGQQHVILSLLSLRERSLISLNLLLAKISSSVWEEKIREKHCILSGKVRSGTLHQENIIGPIIIIVSSFTLKGEICLNSWLHQQCRQRRNSHSVSKSSHTQRT